MPHGVRILAPPWRAPGSRWLKQDSFISSQPGGQNPGSSWGWGWFSGAPLSGSLVDGRLPPTSPHGQPSTPLVSESLLTGTPFSLDQTHPRTTSTFMTSAKTPSPLQWAQTWDPSISVSWADTEGAGQVTVRERTAKTHSVPRGIFSLRPLCLLVLVSRGSPNEFAQTGGCA